MRILLVEDDALTSAAIANHLGDHGHHVTTADDGEIALAILRERGAAFDAVVTDMQMPGRGGDAVAATARSMNAATPVVLVSGDPAALLPLCRPGLGFYVLVKPFRAADLLRLIEGAREIAAARGERAVAAS